MGKGRGASIRSLGPPSSGCLHVFSALQLPGCCPLGFMEPSLHRCGWLNHWTSLMDSALSPSPFPGSQGLGDELKDLMLGGFPSDEAAQQPGVLAQGKTLSTSEHP